MYDVIAVAASVDVSARSPEDVEVVEAENARGRSDSMNAQRAAPALESDLDEDARTLLDVVAGRLHERGGPAAASRRRGAPARPLARTQRAPGPRDWCR